jgi:ESCRT-II complex subunit VPS25
LYELTESEATLSQGWANKPNKAHGNMLIGKPEFHGMDPDLLQRALAILIKRGKAQIFGQEDQQGVKFF